MHEPLSLGLSCPGDSRARSLVLWPCAQRACVPSEHVPQLQGADSTSLSSGEARTPGALCPSHPPVPCWSPLPGALMAQQLCLQRPGHAGRRRKAGLGAGRWWGSASLGLPPHFLCPLHLRPPLVVSALRKNNKKTFSKHAMVECGCTHASSYPLLKCVFQSPWSSQSRKENFHNNTGSN